MTDCVGIISKGKGRLGFGEIGRLNKIYEDIISDKTHHEDRMSGCFPLHDTLSDMYIK